MCHNSFPLLQGLRVIDSNWRVTITQAWFAPINPASIKYNGVELLITGANKQDLQLPEGDYYHRHIENGTAFHAVYFRNNDSDLSVSDVLKIHVHCRKRAGLTGKAIPYALMVTVEPQGASYQFIIKLSNGLGL